MPTFRLKYDDRFDFEGQTAGEIVPILQSRHFLGGESEPKFLRRLAAEMCDFNKKHYCWSDRHSLARSMMKNGLLEIVD